MKLPTKIGLLLATLIVFAAAPLAFAAQPTVGLARQRLSLFLLVHPV